MSTIKESSRPINERVVNRIRPELQRMLQEMGVQYAEWREESVVFHYLDLKVTLCVKSRLRKN